MHCKLLLSLTTAILFLNAATASAQFPAGSAHVAVQTQNPAPVPPLAIVNGVAVPAPPVVLNGVGPAGSPVVLYPMPAPPTPGGTLSVMTPQPTVAHQQTTTLTAPAPVAVTQTHVYAQQQPQTYTPTYYWYYYQPPYQVQHYAPVPVPLSTTHWAPGPVGTDFWTGSAGSTAGYFGPMSNARGEAGHVRYPYYSYRRPWYSPGQPSFNVTIDGPVW